MGYKLKTSIYGDLIADLERAATDMDGDIDTFSSPEQASAGRTDRFRQIARNLASASGRFISSMTDEDGADATHTCFDSAVDRHLDAISAIADWVRGSPVDILERINENRQPTGNLIAGWTQLSSLADAAQDLPALKAEWSANVKRLRSAISGIKNARKACKSPDKEEDSGGDCAAIAAAISKLADAMAGKSTEGGKEEGLLAKINKICAAVGCNDFPVNVPECVTDEAKGMTTRANIPQLITWHMLQMDAMIGKFPIKIKIADTDLDEEGNQEKEISLPNLAEAIAELYGLASTSSIISGTLINIATRNLIESGAIKKSAIQTYFWAEAIGDYLGFEVKERFEKIPFSFNPSEVGNLEKALESCHVEIPCIEFKINKKNNNDWQFSLRELMTAAGIIRAAFFNPVDGNNPGKQMAADFKKLKDDGDEENFDDFVNSIEKGFTDKAGVANPDFPYNRPYDQRPRIREVGGDGDAKEDI